MPTQTYNYGKDASGNQVYESSTPGGAVTPSNAINAIPTSTLGTAPAPIQVAPPPASTDVVPHYMLGAATIAGNTTATATAPTPPSYDPATGKVTDYGKSQGVTDPSTSAPTSIWDKFLSTSTPPPSSASQYQSDYGTSGIDQKTTDVNTAAMKTKAAQSKLAAVTAQIQGLTAKGQAMNLAAEGQGGLQGQLSGLQAENNRKIAIEALPLQVQALAAQAEVASAQGDQQLAQSILQQAQTHLETIFQIHQQDATNQYNYQRDLRDKALQFATDQQKNQLAAQQHKDDQAFQVKLETMKEAHDAAQAKLDAQLKQSDPLYQAQLAKAKADLVPVTSPVVVTKSDGKTTTIPADAFNERQDTINLVNQALLDPYLGRAVGIAKLNPLNSLIPGGANQNVKNILNQIQGKLALDNRSKLKGSGAISDFESRTLERSASSFSTDLSENDAKKQLKQIRGVLTTLNGQTAQIIARDPKTGQSATASADSAAISKMISDGLIVEYQ